MLVEVNGVATSSVQTGVKITAADLLAWADLDTNIAVGEGCYSTLPGVDIATAQQKPCWFAATATASIAATHVCIEHK